MTNVKVAQCSQPSMQRRLVQCRLRLEKLQQSDLSDLEPWPGYFDLRLTEIQAILNHCDLPMGGTWLEVGAGIGLLSWVLAPLADRMIATDLSAQNNVQTHTPGLERAKRFLEYVDDAEVELVEADATNLTMFADRSVHVLLNAWVLEHVSERDRALREFARVLQIGGICLALVPCFSERVTQPASAAMRFLREMGRFALLPFVRPTTFRRLSTGSRGHSVLLYAQRFWQSNVRPISAFLHPHGEYSSFFEELRAGRPSAWLRQFESAGFAVADWFCPMLFPFHLFYGLSPRLSAKWAKATFPLWRLLCRVPGIRGLGTGMAICALPIDGGR